jgi:hypothetical protein
MTAVTAGIDAFRSQTVCSDPGRMADWIAGAPRDLPTLRRLTTGLVFHYRAGGDPSQHGFTEQRLHEIDLRYADDQFAHLHDLTPDAPLTADRAPTQRILGCCRDFTLLLVSLLRSQGVPARSRVGFAGYFFDGWWLDHVVAEVWDADAEQWRLVEPQLPDDFSGAGGRFDLLDVPRDRFLTGDAAWRAARAGELDPSTFVVDPGLDPPNLRSWPYLAHNLVLDLAALTGWEAVLWDVWGLIDASPEELGSPAVATALDQVAATIQGGTPTELAEMAGDPRFAVPATITSFWPLDGTPHTVALRAH